MDERKRKVLRAVVALYGLDGEPVGSGLLAEHFGRAVSSATLRKGLPLLYRQFDGCARPAFRAG